MFMANQQTAELAEPSVGALDDPAALVAPQLAAVFMFAVPVIFPVGGNQLDAALLKSFPQRIRIIAAVSDHPRRLPSRTALVAGNADFGERGFRKRNFCRRGTFQPNSQRKTLTVDQYHPLRALAPLGGTDRRAPFFAAAKLPSRKVSSHRSRPCRSSVPNNARHASSHTPSSSHCCKRRQQVEGEGNSSGRNRHAAPVCNIHRMPSKQARFDAHGRPRLSFLRFGLGNSGAITSQRSSVNSFCRFFMTEVHSITASRVST